ncbi:MAG: hypothetical protein COX52_00185 [Syntrophobacterales bacterium CG23_combo_of_CG06-09_8_20_14_all_48_27]|nr:MAG: hypothetical protein COX52_00185 [Syntrophobacterales bacterium CG23_combo_of_CG06-09_8_20_14_all_48_27]
MEYKIASSDMMTAMSKSSELKNSSFLTAKNMMGHMRNTALTWDELDKQIIFQQEQEKLRKLRNKRFI